MPLSSPLAEKTQMSAVAVPLAGRCSTTRFPAKEQEFVTVEKAPNAATFRSTSAPETDTPAVVGSTTTIVFPVTSGAVLVKKMVSSEAFGAITTSDAAFDVAPFGFR